MMKYPDLTAGDGEFFVNLVGGWERFQQLKRGALTLIVKAPELLKYLTEVTVGMAKKFVTKDHFVVDTSPTAKVRIGHLGDNFKTHFLSKVEKNIGSATLVVHELVKDSLDQPILEHLGDKTETTLAHLWELLSKQSKGEPGVLLNNGRATILYIKDAKGLFWAVHVFWYANYGCWDVYAYSVGSPHSWFAGHRVLSRK